MYIRSDLTIEHTAYNVLNYQVLIVVLLTKYYHAVFVIHSFYFKRNNNKY